LILPGIFTGIKERASFFFGHCGGNFLLIAIYGIQDICAGRRTTGNGNASVFFYEVLQLITNRK